MDNEQLRAWPLVYVILLNWNQRQLTADCLESLRAVSYPRFRVVLVDNGSTDNSVAHIREHYPEVTVLENRENMGFSEGNNVGMRYALESAADYILLLNNDTVVEPKLLAQLVAVAESDRQIGIVTPKIYYYDDPKRIWCAGASINMNNGAIARLQAEELDRAEETEPYQVDFASGCALCVKRKVLEQVGLIDPRFFIYYDETDWCVRAGSAGWKTVYTPQTHLWHKVSAAMGTTSPATDYYMNRNVLLFIANNQRGWRRVITLLRMAGRNLLTALAYTLKSHQGQRLPNRNARILAIRDALSGRWGKMGDDVAAICRSAKAR